MFRVGQVLKQQSSKLKHVSNNNVTNTAQFIRQYSTKNNNDDLKNKYSDLLEDLDEEYTIDKRKIEVVKEKKAENNVDIDKEIANISLKDLKLRRYEDNHEDYELMKKMHVNIQDAFEMDFTTKDLIEQEKQKKEAELTGSKFKSYRLSYQNLSSSKTQFIGDQLVKFKDQFEKPLVDIYNEVNNQNNLLFRSRKAKERLMSRLLKKKSQKPKLTSLERHYIDLIQVRNALDYESKSLHTYGDEDDAWTRIIERTLIQDPHNLGTTYMTDTYEDLGKSEEINEEYLNMISVNPFNFANPNSYSSMVNLLSHIEADYTNTNLIDKYAKNISKAYIKQNETNPDLIQGEFGEDNDVSEESESNELSEGSEESEGTLSKGSGEENNGPLFKLGSLKFENLEEYKKLFEVSNDEDRDKTIQRLNNRIKIVRETGTYSVEHSKTTQDVLNFGRLSIENGSPLLSEEAVVGLVPDDDEIDNEDFSPEELEEQEAKAKAEDLKEQEEGKDEVNEDEDEEEFQEEDENAYDPEDLLQNDVRLIEELSQEFPDHELYRVSEEVVKVQKTEPSAENTTTTTTSESPQDISLGDIKNEEVVESEEVEEVEEYEESGGLDNLYAEIGAQDFNDIDLDDNLGAYETEELENQRFAADEEYEYEEDIRGEAREQPDLKLLSARIALYEEKVLNQVANKFANSEVNEQSAMEALDILFENYKEQNILNPDVIEHDKNTIKEVNGDIAVPDSVYLTYDATNRDLVDKDIEFGMHLKNTDLIRVLTQQLNDTGLLKQEKFLKKPEDNVPLTKEEVLAHPELFPDFAKDLLNDGKEFNFNPIDPDKLESYDPITGNAFVIPKTVSGDEIYDERRLYINFKPFVPDNGVVQIPKISKKYKLIGKRERTWLEKSDNWLMGAPIDISRWRMRGDTEEGVYSAQSPDTRFSGNAESLEEFVDEDDVEDDVNERPTDLTDYSVQNAEQINKETELYRYLQEGGAEEWFRPEKITEEDVLLLERGMDWFPREHLTTYPYQFVHSKSPTDQSAHDLWNNRKAILKVNVSAFNLPKVTEDRLAQLAGKRYNRERNILVLISNNLKTVEENKHQCKRLFKDLLYEANLADPNFISTKIDQFPQRDPNSFTSFIPSQAAKSQSSYSLFRLYGFPNASIQFAKNQSMFNLINEKLN